MKNLKIGIFLIILGNLLYLLNLYFGSNGSSPFGDFTSGGISRIINRLQSFGYNFNRCLYV